MKPILVARKSVFALSPRDESRWPAIQTSPEVKSSIPDRQFSKVVFPHPEGPMIATISPFRMSRSTPRSAWTSTPPLSYVLTRRRAMTIRSSARRGFPSAAEAGRAVIDSDTKGFPSGNGCGEPRDGPQAERGEGDEEHEQRGGLGFDREGPKERCSSDDSLGRKSTEE